VGTSETNGSKIGEYGETNPLQVSHRKSHIDRPRSEQKFTLWDEIGGI
jgi:hypothetical protein